MAQGKFSSPRPHREEDRQIEKAYRQLTGQEPKPPRKQPGELDDLSLFVEAAEETLLSPEPEMAFREDYSQHFPPQDSPCPGEPEEDFREEWEEEESLSFADRFMDFLEKAVEVCSRNRKVVLVCICAAALALIVGIISVFFASTADPYDHKILNNVFVAGVDVGGMTKQEATAALKGIPSQRYAQEDMVLDLAGTSLRISAGDASVKFNVKTAVNAAYDYGRTGTNAQKQQAYEASLTTPYVLPLSPHLEINERRIREKLEAYAQETGNTLTQTKYGLEGTQPELSADKFDEDAPGQTLVIHMGTPGISFEPSLVLHQIKEAYGSFTFQVSIQDMEEAAEPDPLDLQAVYEEFYIAPINASVEYGKPVSASYGYGFDLEKAKALLKEAEFGQEIRIPMEYIEPEITDEGLHFRDVLGEHKTAFTWNKNRVTNMTLACEAINGVELEPGEVFSFNNTVGQHSSERGYLYASPDPANGDEAVLGGGIAQVSSTLYYTALLSEMGIRSRWNHTYPVGYIDYGLDAAISWGKEDLTFTNSTDFPIRIEAQATEGYVTIRILGTEQRDHYIRLESRIQNTYVPDTEYKDMDADNDKGYKDGDVIRKGRSGFHVKTYLLQYDRKTNMMLSRTEITDSRYDPLSEILVRIKPEPTTEPTTVPTEPPTESTAGTTAATETTQAPTETTQAPTETTKATEPTQASTTAATDSSAASESLENAA